LKTILDPLTTKQEANLDSIPQVFMRLFPARIGNVNFFKRTNNEDESLILKCLEYNFFIF